MFMAGTTRVLPGLFEDGIMPPPISTPGPMRHDTPDKGDTLLVVIAYKIQLPLEA